MGKFVSTEPFAALTGREEVSQATGTLGPSVRAKVPVFAPDSDKVVGQVSVGMSTSWVYRLLSSDLRAALLTGGPALLTGGCLPVLLARRWRKQTLDLQPIEMTELVRTQEAVLHGIGEGVLAADTNGNTTFVNDEACRLLEIGSVTGQPVDQIGLTPRVLVGRRLRSGRRRWPTWGLGCWCLGRCRGRARNWAPCSSSATAPTWSR